MNAIEMAHALDLEILVAGAGEERELNGIYCCDLLSVVMGQAKADDVWITVMGNINAIAVAVLADVSCILLSENTQMDEPTLKKAEQQDVCVLRSTEPTYELSKKISALCGL